MEGCYLCDICLSENRAIFFTRHIFIHVENRKAEWIERLKRGTSIMIIAFLTKHFVTVFQTRVVPLVKSSRKLAYFYLSLDVLMRSGLFILHCLTERMIECIQINCGRNLCIALHVSTCCVCSTTDFINPSVLLLYI